MNTGNTRTRQFILTFRMIESARRIPTLEIFSFSKIKYVNILFKLSIENEMNF